MGEYVYKKLIVIEGVDGSGKSTQAELLEEYLKKNGKKVIKIHCPDYDYYSGKSIRDMLDGKFSKDANSLNTYAISSMYSVDRYCIVNKSYRDYFLNKEYKGYYIIMDRYTQSNLIHQGSKLVEYDSNSNYHLLSYNSMLNLREYGNWLLDLEYTKMGLPRPDKIWYLHLPYEESYKRVVERGNTLDIHENKDFMSKSYSSGIYYANTYFWDIVECMDGNRAKTVQEVHKDILDRLKGVI